MEGSRKRPGGRGRGAGRGAAWGGQDGRQDAPRPGPRQKQAVPAPEKAARTFQEASAEIQANLQRHLQKQRSEVEVSAAAFSSDEEDSGGDDGNGVSEEVLDKIFGSYDADGGNQGDRTRQAVLSAITKGHSACLICISSIKRHDAIWSCGNCYCSFHLTCIQRWAKDSIFQQKNDQESEFPDLSSAPPSSGRNGSTSESRPKLLWGCPKCRHPHAQEEIPSRYDCFCGKTRDPEFDPWIVPHSCGETCGKKLKPECGHECLILCHPGPCPPCPKMVTSSCFCGQSAPAARRCFDRAWSCGRPCGRMLNCGQHRCPRPCHEGECGPCQRTSVQLCQCQRKQQQVLCATPEWTCGEKCGRALACGHHICDVVCHSGDCPPCPLSELRRCPCGKTTHRLPCTLATPTCSDTCGKRLGCGEHVCAERCHRGACGACLQMVTKVCRCGNRRKEVPCAKQFFCELKCKRLKDCRKHTCNRKCCNGECPPCEQNCGRNLACKNHKCASRCHQGACYPCNQTKEVTCNCSASRLLVPCGREKATPPPKCRQRCQNQPDCHHDEREAHRCHFGNCPPCKQPCSQTMKCGHSCPAPCHDNVKVVIKDGPKASTPWEETGPKAETRAVACPDCQHPVPVTCLGSHETADWPCHAAKVGPCGRKCGRHLACGNHTCSRDCHRVKGASSDESAGTNCRKCEVECRKARPDGCVHACNRPCHPGNCEQCKQIMRVWCHCGLSQLYVKCGEWTTSAGQEKEDLACCKNQCPKIMSCGHRCTKICHSDSCSDPSTCRKKTKVLCACKRRKEERPCAGGGGADAVVKCDDECARIKKEAAKSKEMEDQRRKEEEERQQREELERFEKKLEGRRKRRDRRRRSESAEEGFLSRHWMAMVALLVVAAACGVAYYRLVVVADIDGDDVGVDEAVVDVGASQEGEENRETSKGEEVGV